MRFHGYYLLHEHPRIISTWDEAVVSALAAQPAPEPTYCLIHLPWNHAVGHRMLRKKLRFFQLSRRGFRPLLFTNFPREDRYRAWLGLPGTQCSAYVYVDEKQYAVLPGEKKYDAIYTAQLQRFKRIELAQGIQPLFVLTYTPGQSTNDLPRFCPAVSHADYNQTWVDAAEKNRVLNQAKVGLCLSAEEGPMLASLEYLLAGLPVVSTPSRGGRATYYTNENSLIVPATVADVKAGVRLLIEKQTDSLLIRRQALAQLNRDRDRYVDFISEYVKKDSGLDLDTGQLRQKLFGNPLANFVPVHAAGQ